jgi:SAM-dependent methyltransferase
MKICVFCNAHFDENGWLCPKCHLSPAIEGDIPLFVPTLAHEVDKFFYEAYAETNASEKTYFWSTARQNLLMWMFRKHLSGSKQFLEIGCGSGWFLSEVHKAFPALELYATQMALQEIEATRSELSEVHFIQTDASVIPFEAHFDSIAMFDVLEHVREDEKALTQIYKALKPGGKVIITVPQHPWLWSAFDEVADHKRRYTRRDLVTKMEQAGFEIVRVTSFMSLLLPLMVMSRRRATTQYNRQAELNINPTLNRILKGVLDIEAAILKTGVSLPFGGSLLVVAQSRG